MMSVVLMTVRLITITFFQDNVIVPMYSKDIKIT